MKHGVSQWLLGLGLVAYPLACLVLIFLLVQHPPLTITEEEPEPEPALTAPETVEELPDFAAIDHIPDRKEAFYQLLIPMIEWRNYQLSGIREEVEQMHRTLDEQEPLTAQQQRRLERLRVHFRVSEDNYPTDRQALAALRHRADVIPASMVLAQAAAESGWGTSRFAVEGNNLFGQWCYRKGCGMVPGARSEGMSHEVQVFDSVNEAVATYFRNINTNRAYRELRQIRASLRAQELPLTGIALVEGLQRYSSRGQAYIEELKELIRYNDLENIQQQLAQADDIAESADPREEATP